MNSDFRSKTRKQMELKKLAARITDEDHLNRILADTRPGFHGAVRHALRPYLSFKLRDEEESDSADA